MTHHYGKPLSAVVKGGVLTIEIGVDVLAHATAFADWANPYDEEAQDYIRTFAITDTSTFAVDVAHAMQHEQEDGSSPLSDFLDAMTKAALDDGSVAAEYEQRIENGKCSPLETWALADPSGPGQKEHDK